jgi:hypothetical protein
VKINLYLKNQKPWPKAYTQPISSAVLQSFHEQAFFTRKMPPNAVSPVIPGPRPPLADAQIAVFNYPPGKGAVAGGFGGVGGKING